VVRLYRIVQKDTLRRRRRVLYTALGVVVGVAVVIAVMTVANAGESKIYEELDKYGANLTVTPAVDDVQLQLGGMNLGNLSVGENYIEEDKVPDIRRITDGAIRERLGDSLGVAEGEPIATIAPKLYMNTKAGDASLVAVGIDTAEERGIKTWWESSGGYPVQPDEALLGQRASEALHLGEGDMVNIEGLELRVVGVLGETGSVDDYQMFIPLATAQNISGKQGLVSSVDVRALCNGCPVEVIAGSINSQVTGVRAVAVKQIANNEMNLVSKVKDFLLALAGITLVVGIFGVVNTMMSSVHERVRDIGIMKAVGASRSQIVRMFLYEAVIVGLVGGIVGYAAGTALSYAVGPLIFQGVAMGYVLSYLPAALVIAVSVSVVASAYPAFRASRIRVCDSIRSV
jgi:putative ABC transport system permease protein